MLHDMAHSEVIAALRALADDLEHGRTPANPHVFLFGRDPRAIQIGNYMSGHTSTLADMLEAFVKRLDRELTPKKSH